MPLFPDLRVTFCASRWLANRGVAHPPGPSKGAAFVP